MRSRPGPADGASVVGRRIAEPARGAADRITVGDGVVLGDLMITLLPTLLVSPGDDPPIGRRPRSVSPEQRRGGE